MAVSTTLVEAPDTRIQTRELRPGEEADCDRFVMSSPSGTIFHLSGWRKVVEDVLGHSSFCLVARRDRRITGVFPISLVRNRLFGDSLISLPLAVYGGICSDDHESYCELLEAGKALAQRLRVNYLEMRNRTEPFPLPLYLPKRDLYLTFTQDLSAGPEKLLAGLPRDTRYVIRKSMKAGLAWTDNLDLDEFYNIYARSVHRLGTPVFSRKLFVRLLRELPAHTRIFGVRKEGRAIAGVLCLYFKGLVMPYYGGALSEFYKDSPNNFMYWNLISQSCQEGYRSFDFGRSKRGSGSSDFKSSWAMQITPLPYRYHLVRAKEVPELSPVDAKFRLPIAVWKQLPFTWTKILGPRLVQWIPSV